MERMAKSIRNLFKKPYKRRTNGTKKSKEKSRFSES
jgi:hypothetical protein